jgi:hypothetical protein
MVAGKGFSSEKIVFLVNARQMAIPKINSSNLLRGLKPIKTASGKLYPEQFGKKGIVHSSPKDIARAPRHSHLVLNGL